MRQVQMISNLVQIGQVVLWDEVEVGTDRFSGKTVVTPTKRKVEVVSKFSKRTAVQDDQAECRRGWLPKMAVYLPQLPEQR